VDLGEAKRRESGMQASVATSLLRISYERAEVAFALLSAPDAKSRDKEHEGRRILAREDGRRFIVSHQEYQHLASRAASTERQTGNQLPYVPTVCSMLAWPICCCR
jgi:hypothetical protein